MEHHCWDNKNDVRQIYCNYLGISHLVFHEKEKNNLKNRIRAVERIQCLVVYLNIKGVDLLDEWLPSLVVEIRRQEGQPGSKRVESKIGR